jgi:hypothetical protein
MSRVRKNAFFSAHPVCIFCGGGEKATTIEHCPPRAMFQFRDWPEGFEFPACESCNHGTADHDLIISLNRHDFSRYSSAVRNAAFQTRLVTAVH